MKIRSIDASIYNDNRQLVENARKINRKRRQIVKIGTNNTKIDNYKYEFSSQFNLYVMRTRFILGKNVYKKSVGGV
jgi:hypothetical protein